MTWYHLLKINDKLDWLTLLPTLPVPAHASTTSAPLLSPRYSASVSATYSGSLYDNRDISCEHKQYTNLFFSMTGRRVGVGGGTFFLCFSQIWDYRPTIYQNGRTLKCWVLESTNDNILKYLELKNKHCLAMFTLCKALDCDSGEHFSHQGREVHERALSKVF